MDVTINSKFNQVTQYLLPALTISAQMLMSLKLPQYGLVVNLLAQPFWLYSCWKAYKHAGQSGMLISTIIFTVVTAFGIVNYWFL